MSNFSGVLQLLRTKRNISQAELAKFIKVQESTIINYENGTEEPGYKALLDIADFFRVTADYLLGRQDVGSFLDRSAILSEERQLLDRFMNQTEALVKEKGNINAENLRSVMRMMELAYLEDLHKEKLSR